jgi:hypothetical protein
MHVRTILDVLAEAQGLFDLCRIREATVLYTQGQSPIMSRMEKFAAYQ